VGTGNLTLSGAACAGGRAAARCLCLQDVGGSVSGLAPLISDEKRIRGALV